MNYNIELLIQFALNQGMIQSLDIPQVRNQIMEVLNVSEPYDGEIETESPTSPIPILEELLDGAVAAGLIEGTTTERDLLDAKIMAQLMPRQSELYRMYQDIVKEKGIIAATDFFYKISQDSNYIRMDRIAKNKVWLSHTDYGQLEITINLSKPEKDPKEIAKARTMVQSNYPKCLLCLENVGFKGHLNHPGRSNHRVLPVTLNNEAWYFQYSPYVYYNEHAIIFKGAHEPMKISRESFVRLLDFVTEYPHYFLGSNADLPIVGGSILTHDHFQGGHHVFPMAVAQVTKTYQHPEYPGMTIQNVKWPLSVVRVSGPDKQQLIEFAMHVYESWKPYSDESLEILAFSGDVPHNTITPIARVNDLGLFELDLVLRNNRQSTQHPDGIFHPHQHLHHIKKENIGLIEVMGLAVLPARLDEELVYIQDLITGKLKVAELPDFMNQHLNWANELIELYGTTLEAEAAWTIVQEEVGKKFSQVLECAGVYKMDDKGQLGLERFMNSLGC